MAVDGDAARAIGELARKRWKIASGDRLPQPSKSGDCWPERLKPTFLDVSVALARTRGRDGPVSEVREIEALFLNLIRAAKRTVYIETQYFASRTVAEAIAARLQEQNGPEFVIVNPKTAEGWLDESVMGPARYELIHALRKWDRHHHFRVYTPVTEGGADIYVHAKIMIVDEVFLRIGSANLNNRSMGLDSECDLLVDARDDDTARRTIEAIRTDLLAEHLGVEPTKVAARAQGSLIDTIEHFRGTGRTLIPFDPPKPGKLKQILATRELFDPEGPDEIFEPRARPGLLWRLRKP